jgi:uncharacterized protein YkuJ
MKLVYDGAPKKTNVAFERLGVFTCRWCYRVIQSQPNERGVFSLTEYQRGDRHCFKRNHPRQNI